MKNYYLKNKSSILYYFIYLMFIIVVFVGLNNKSLMDDEPFTFNMINHNFIDIIHLTAQDVHPFIYYFIAKIFTYNIHNVITKIFILRLSSALPYLILLIIGNTYIKNHFSKLTSQIFMLSMISMPLFVDNITNIRMYGWATLFTIIFYCIFLYVYNNGNNNTRNFALLSVLALMASYTHYYAFMTVAIVYFIFLILFILHNMKLRYMILSICINLLLYLPWIFVIINQLRKATNDFWSPKIKINDVFHMSLGVLSPVYHFPIFYILPLFFIIFLLIIVFDKNIKKDKIFMLSIIYLFVPFILMLCGTLISIIVNHSLLMIRYIMPAMGIFWLSISIIIGKIHNNKIMLKLILIFIIILISLISYARIITHNISSSNQYNSSINIVRKLPQNSVFIYNNSNVMYSSSVYINNNNFLKFPHTSNTSSIYNKVFDNIKENNGVNLPSNYKNLFYVEAKYIDSKYNSSKLSTKFKNKYKMKKINNISIGGYMAKIYKIIPTSH